MKHVISFLFFTLLNSSYLLACDCAPPSKYFEIQEFDDYQSIAVIKPIRGLQLDIWYDTLYYVNSIVIESYKGKQSDTIRFYIDPLESNLDSLCDENIPIDLNSEYLIFSYDNEVLTNISYDNCCPLYIEIDTADFFHNREKIKVMKTLAEKKNDKFKYDVFDNEFYIDSLILEYTQRAVISGGFKNNNRSGKWKFVNYNVTGTSDNIVFDYSNKRLHKIERGRYSNGKKTGVWIIEYITIGDEGKVEIISERRKKYKKAHNNM